MKSLNFRRHATIESEIDAAMCVGAARISELAAASGPHGGQVVSDAIKKGTSELYYAMTWRSWFLIPIEARSSSARLSSSQHSMLQLSRGQSALEEDRDLRCQPKAAKPHSGLHGP